MREPATVAARAAVTAHRGHERVAAVWRDPDRADGRWQSTTWGELGRCWRHGALGLEARGVALGDLVGVVAEPGPDSMAIDHGVLAAGAASVPVEPDELGKLSGLGVRRIVARRQAALPEAASNGFEIIDWDVAVADGASIDGEQPDRFEKLVERIPPDAIATADVSATDAVLRTHAELLWAARSFARLVTMPADDERDDHTVALVPIRGLVGRAVAYDWPSMTGATVWWPGALGAVDAIREAQPTVLAAPAATWRALADAAIAGANHRWVALGRLAAAEEPLGRLDRGLHRMLRRLLRKGRQRRLGLDRCTGAAADREARPRHGARARGRRHRGSTHLVRRRRRRSRDRRTARWTRAWRGRGAGAGSDDPGGSARDRCPPARQHRVDLDRGSRPARQRRRVAPASMNERSEHTNEPAKMQGGAIIRLSWIGTGVYGVTAAIATVSPDGFGVPAVIVSLALFGLGCVDLPVGLPRRGPAQSHRSHRHRRPLLPRRAPHREPSSSACSAASRRKSSSPSSPPSIRLYSPLAFGFLVPVYGLGLCGLWGARYGTFEPRPVPEP